MIFEAYGLFTYIGSYRYFFLVIFFVWYAAATWIYRRAPQFQLLQPAIAKPLPDDRPDEGK
ncbi:hypothetical protein [Propionispora sp. 2/2-37]|uniref:hypothetical protein n=1 Tax=Propionispora sp. 2/2-37 TaxID=1677858 RepID=UPI001C0FABE1|nr:hypothetical protein [Propionispora sp. 2/2-37]